MPQLLMKSAYTSYEIKMHEAVSRTEHNTAKQKADHNPFAQIFAQITLCIIVRFPQLPPSRP